MKKLLVVIVLLFVLCISFSCKNKKHEYNKVYKEDGIQYINYGKFPQTHVSNSKTIKELDKITDTNSSGYYEYNGNEYAKIEATPHNVALNTTYSDGKEITKNTTEYFLVEPIKWYITSTSSGKYTLLSEYVLDVQKFQISQNYCEENTDSNKNKVKYIYANNYVHSIVRDYLNNEFFNKAFTSKEQRKIITSHVDNSVNSSMYADYNQKLVPVNSKDNIYLLCYKDIYDKTIDSTKLTAKVTDYAIARGCFFQTDNDRYYLNGEYWLRSIAYLHDQPLEYYWVSTVNVTGSLSKKSCDTTHCGVRPVMQRYE